MIKRIVILVFSICSVLQAQNNFTYRQFVLNQLGLNPAYTGSREVFALANLYRTHMVSIDEGNPITATVSADAPLKKTQYAVGMYAIQERIGNTSNTNIDLNYAFRVPLGNGKLSMGLKASINMFGVNPPQNLNDPNDLVFETMRETYFLPNAGFGLYYYNYNKYFIGFSIPNLLAYKADQGSSGYKMDTDVSSIISNFHYTTSAGILLLQNNDNVQIRLSAMGEYDIATNAVFDMNTMFIIKNLVWVGASYNTSGIMAYMVQGQINPQLRVGFAYDYNTSFNSTLGGGFELMIKYEFSYIIKAVSPIF